MNFRRILYMLIRSLFPDDVVSLEFIREKVIVANTKKNLDEIVIAKLAFASVAKSILSI